MREEPIIKVKNLTKVFELPHERYSTMKQHFVNFFRQKYVEKLKALDNVSFEIKKGEFFGIIGPNGSGKSTLLKILAQIFQPTSGQIEITGTLSPFIELGVGFNPELSARDNVFLNAAVLGLSKKETEDRFDEIIKFSELEEFVDQKLKNFSSGMQVRLAFSIAIQAQADILLVDEVLAVGDAAFQQKCFEVFRTLKKVGKTIIFVSHQFNAVEDFCDRVALLHDGRIRSIGETEEVVRKYQQMTLAKRSDTVKEITTVDKRWGTGEVRFKSIKIYDENSSEVSLLKSGQNYSFILDYTLKKRVDKLNVGIGVYSVQGAYCFGVNTKMDGYGLDVGRAVELQIDSFPLNEGEYYYNVVFFGDEETQPYDWVGEAGRFVVESDFLQRGVVVLKYRWKNSN
ncbi:MAG: hypothetical protein A2Y57_01610 [Candidatus Woykebacteria bacterium RBG_13_40_7b]|uniref:ABC transporter domain-containing protein n=1 Tax=Candidatus Woykebacteria bacterium RBG_13_40_7b TaxID=1802594 RepID=A0A1G1W794_9BACT|nr:MAG: hypothetical protein A2Y57_01610 [Candidatus Woykebacteria bacterium RBG_13_40_7b]